MPQHVPTWCGTCASDGGAPRLFRILEKIPLVIFHASPFKHAGYLLTHRDTVMMFHLMLDIPLDRLHIGRRHRYARIARLPAEFIERSPLGLDIPVGADFHLPDQIAY